VLAEHLHVEQHGFRVRVNLHDAHLAAVLAGVDVEGDHAGFVGLDEPRELHAALLERLELAPLSLCVPMKMTAIHCPQPGPGPRRRLSPAVVTPSDIRREVGPVEAGVEAVRMAAAGMRAR
jgi:hypothetical protein